MTAENETRVPPKGWPDGKRLPTEKEARDLLQESEQSLRGRLKELRKKLPRWDSDMESTIIGGCC